MTRLHERAEVIENIANSHGTPFYLYDERGIRDNARRLNAAFRWNEGFREYFAVKANPNPWIVRILHEEGCGADCSSMPELVLSERLGIRGDAIMFTSNNTPLIEYQKAHELGALINLDDITHINMFCDAVGAPEQICFRYNPGPLREGNAIIGKPEEAKYGLTRKQLFDGYATCRDMGARRFGLHTMVASNELNPQYFIATARMLFELALEIRERLEIRLSFVNFGGGIGIPYRPGQSPVDYDDISAEVKSAYNELIASTDLHPLQIYLENGRCMTGPYGCLVTRVVHRKSTYKEYIGVDATMANLMRPGMYGAYHHITVTGKEHVAADRCYDVVGSLCENNDKFAIDRVLPAIEIGDLLVIHDAGAHGHAMGFQYNGKLRCAEHLLKTDSTIAQIRRAETIDDYFATIDWPAR